MAPFNPSLITSHHCSTSARRCCRPVFRSGRHIWRIRPLQPARIRLVSVRSAISASTAFLTHRSIWQPTYRPTFTLTCIRHVMCAHRRCQFFSKLPRELIEFHLLHSLLNLNHLKFPMHAVYHVFDVLSRLILAEQW